MRTLKERIKKGALAAMALCLCTTIVAQDGYSFARDRKGNVKSRSEISDSFREKFPGVSPEFLKGRLEKIAGLLLSSETVKGAKGVDTEAYGSVSEFTNVDLSFKNLVRSERDPPGEYYHKGSSSLNVFINDRQSASGNILRFGFFELPVRTGEFNGYPVYEAGIFKYVLAAPGVSNPFIPCTKEDFIRERIREEQEKMKSAESADLSETDEMKKNLSEVKTQYAEMKRMAESMKQSDPEGAAALKEAVKGMELMIKEVEETTSRDFKAEALEDPQYQHYKEVVQSLEAELNAMSTAERAQQAVWSQGAQEVTGKYSELVPDQLKEHGTPLYKLHPALQHSSERINFMTVVFLESLPGMERTPADGCIEQIRGESQIWKQIFSLVEAH
jgi:hypothetical protein